MQDVARFISAIRKFKFFSRYDGLMRDTEWMSLGLSATIKTFGPYETICKRLQPARVVYLILSGDIIVTKERKKKLSKEKLEGKILAFLKPGMSFGEIGVLYNTKR